ncbi:MAG: response regulator [Candidatus Delongbacteria bacterium]
MSLRVLIADDSAMARMFLKRCLEATGLPCEVREAVNGREALDLLLLEPADVLITDLVMPVMDGEELLRQVKDDPLTAGVQVVVVSSASNESRRDRLIVMGAKAVLEKPLSPSNLAAVLQQESGDSWGEGEWA